MLNRLIPKFSQMLSGGLGYFLVPFLLGGLISSALYYYAEKRVDNLKAHHLNQEINNSIDHISDETEIKLGTLDYLRTFFGVSESINRQNFRVVAKSLLDNNPYIQALEWIPRVRKHERSVYVTQAHEQGMENFAIRQRDHQGKMIIAGDRDEYFPVYYVEPEGPNLRAVGFDLASSPSRLQALKLSGQQSLKVISEPVDLVQGSQKAVLAFLPVYKRVSKSSNQLLTWDDLNGFVLMVIRTQDFFRHIISSAEKKSSVALQILDVESKTVLAKSRLYPESLIDLDTTQFQRQIEVGYRKWRISGVSMPDAISSNNVLLLFLGFAVSFFIALFIYSQKRQAHRIYQEVRVRTGELNESSQHLDIANQRLELAMLSTSQGIWDWNIVTNEVYFSPSMEAMAGYEPGSWQGEQVLWSKLIEPEEYEGVWACVQEHLRGETEYYEHEHRLTRKDGSKMWIRDHGRVVEWDDAGSPIRMIGSHIDIGDQKIIQEELIAAKEAAEQAAIAKTQFLSTMSHEIRTPMNGVMGMAQLLEGTPLSNEQRDYVETINRSGNNLLALINDILDFSKLDADKTALEAIPFDFERMCLESMDLFSGKAVEKNIDLIVDYDIESQRYLIGDPSRLRQVILNLIGNAVKFTESGYIRLKVDCEEMSENWSRVRLEVEDAGIGMPDSAIANLFDEFSQVDQATTRKFGGTGLGLAITKKLVTLMGGKIEVESKEGIGSTFRVLLQLPNADTPKRLVSGSLQGVKVLLVDDRQENLQIFGKLLKQFKVDLVTTNNASGVVEMLCAAERLNQAFQIAILDHRMPDLSGLELGTRIREVESLDKLRLMLFSSAGERGDAEVFKQAGFDGYLGKLSRKETIEEMLLALLSGKRDGNIITQHSIEDSKQVDAEESFQISAHILLVEDIKTNQFIAKKILTNFGATVDIANNGEEAVEQWQANQYQMILMDCRMPVMDGYQATIKIRELESRNKDPGIPIVALTANASVEDRLLCEEAGMNDVITKPFRRQDLQQSLEIWLQDDRYIECAQVINE